MMPLFGFFVKQSLLRQREQSVLPLRSRRRRVKVPRRPQALSVESRYAVLAQDSNFIRCIQWQHLHAALALMRGGKGLKSRACLVHVFAAASEGDLLAWAWGALGTLLLSDRPTEGQRILGHAQKIVNNSVVSAFAYDVLGPFSVSALLSSPEFNACMSCHVGFCTPDRIGVCDGQGRQDGVRR